MLLFIIFSNRPYKYVDFPKSHRGVSEVEMFIYALIFLDAVGLFHLIVTFVNKVKRARQAAQELENNTKTTQVRCTYNDG